MKWNCRQCSASVLNMIIMQTGHKLDEEDDDDDDDDTVLTTCNVWHKIV